MEHTLEDFYKAATEKFGEKFTIKEIQVTDEQLDNFNAQSTVKITRENIQEYKECWLLENKCPNCGAELGGLFGSFEWGIVHGVGKCSECNEVSFRLYHYIGGSRIPIEAFSLIGF